MCVEEDYRQTIEAIVPRSPFADHVIDSRTEKLRKPGPSNMARETNCMFRHLLSLEFIGEDQKLCASYYSDGRMIRVAN